VRTANLIASIAATIKETAAKALNHLLLPMINLVIPSTTSSTKIEKKSARWVPKLLSEEQKQERVHACNEFISAVRRRSMAMLDNIVTMISHHTPETKKQSKQWIKKGQPGPLKARVHASQTKQMILAFFDSKGLIYTNIVPRGRVARSR
jgi:hypothetical protein